MEKINIENKKIYTLKDWSVVSSRQIKDVRYKPPECLQVSLQGLINNHPYLKDNSFVTTNSVYRVDGCYIETLSGSIYKLDGEPSEDYKKFCQKYKITINLENPIKVL